MILTWKTSHYINERVTQAFHHGIKGEVSQYKHVGQNVKDLLPSVSYGILRGTGDIFHKCAKAGLDYWEIDRGYFKPNHFDGYYRISKNNTRCKFRPNVVSSERWDSLNIPIAPYRQCDTGSILLCPPTSYVAEFFGVDVDQWIAETKLKIQMHTTRHIKDRHKDSVIPIAYDLLTAHSVVTFNSNVAIDALLAGVKVIAPDCPDVYSWNGLSYDAIEGEYNFDRKALMSWLACCQFTLDEFQSGLAWSMTRAIQ